MTLNSDIRIIQYLGSKVKLIPEIKFYIDKLICKGDLVVDLFAGTGVVGNSLKEEYKIISNDIQEYSYLMNKVLLTNEIHKTIHDYSIDELYSSIEYKNNYKELETYFSRALSIEDKILKESNYYELSRLTESQIFYNANNYYMHKSEENQKFAFEIFKESIQLFSDEVITSYKNNNKLFPYSLFSIYYLNSYFSLRQCIEIDSLRYAIDSISDIDYKQDDLKQILLACLLHSISEIVSSVGKQFAQPIKTISKDGKIKDFAINRCMRDMKKNIKDYMVNMFSKFKLLESSSFINNEVYNLEYNDLFEKLKNKHISAFYVDPPYTIDHYSRFYHIPETLIKYDYPKLESRTYKGKQVLMRGRYRVDRFQSNFCVPSLAGGEFNNLFDRIKSFNSIMLLSYSDYMDEGKSRKRVISKDELYEILRMYFSDVEVINLDHTYRKLNKEKNNSPINSNSEILFICK